MTLRFLIPVIAVGALLAGCESYGEDGPGYMGHHDRYAEGDYDAGAHYRDDPRYQERPMSRDEQVYRGGDGRYYCKRSDGTTGLIVGGLAGGALGDVIAPRGSKTLGTILGAVGGAAIGSSVDSARCR